MDRPVNNPFLKITLNLNPGWKPGARFGKKCSNRERLEPRSSQKREFLEAENELGQHPEESATNPAGTIVLLLQLQAWPWILKRPAPAEKSWKHGEAEAREDSGTQVLASASANSLFKRPEHCDQKPSMLHFTHLKICFIWYSQAKRKPRETDFSAVLTKTELCRLNLHCLAPLHAAPLLSSPSCQRFNLVEINICLSYATCLHETGTVETLIEACAALTLLYWFFPKTKSSTIASSQLWLNFWMPKRPLMLRSCSTWWTPRKILTACPVAEVLEWKNQGRLLKTAKLPQSLQPLLQGRWRRNRQELWTF